jgi:hypothetical protein
MYRNAVRDFVYKAWNLPDTLNEYWFPGPQPISIERRHFSLLKKSDYLVAEKTDGIRHLLVSFETKEGEKCVALVNRAFEVTCLQKYTLAKDTILDGELVIRNDDRQIFLVHDAVMIRGESLLQRSLTERLDKARSLAKTILSKSPFTTLVKQMVPLSAMDTLEQGMYKTDGLVFTPVSEPIQTGTHESMFKWKPREHITIDFQIAGGTKLYIQERGRLIQEAELHLTKEFYPDGTIVECGYGDVGWYVVKVRTDKTYPNNRRTFMRTIVNLREDIKREEFLFEEYGTSERT